MSARTIAIVAAVVVALLIASGCFFSVNQRQRALVLQFGEIKQVDVAPGLHFKWPFLQQVRRFDDRVLPFDSGPVRYPTADKTNVMVDTFVKWKIKDIAAFYRSTGGDEARATDRISQSVQDALRGALTKRTVQEVVSTQRDEVADAVKKAADTAVAGMGVHVVDVRIKRIELPDKVADAVYDRMRAERKRLASSLRAQGSEAAVRIRAEAERQRTGILSQAYAESQKIRGEGDARAAAIYAEAYGKDPDFYRFYKSLQIYQHGWQDKGDVLVLDSDSKLFRYFQPPGKTR